MIYSWLQTLMPLFLLKVKDIKLILPALLIALVAVAAILVVRRPKKRKRGGRHRGTKLYKSDIKRCEKLLKKRMREKSYEEAAVMARHMLEYMLKGIYISGGKEWPANTSNLKKIDMLYQNGFISEKTQSNYHTIRKYTNSGAHIEKRVTKADMERVEELLKTELRFYYGK